MTGGIANMTIEELRELIAETVRETWADLMEDFLASTSTEYLRSITEARRDYKAGRVVNLDKLPEV